MFFGYHCAHEQGGANRCASAADEAFAPPFAGLARERSKPYEGSNLLVAELPELGQLGHKGACDDGSDARHGSEQFFLGAPSGRAFHGIVDICIGSAAATLLFFGLSALRVEWRLRGAFTAFRVGMFGIGGCGLVAFALWLIGYKQ